MLALVEHEMRAQRVGEPLRVTAAFTNGEKVYAVRYASTGKPETLYTRQRRDNSGRLLVSEPLDDGRDDWLAVPPQSFVELTQDHVTWHDFRAAA
jgi:glutamine amidotransferase